MGLESATYLNDLNAANPTISDLKNQGDDHLRLIKAVLQATLPGLDGASAFAAWTPTLTVDTGTIASAIIVARWWRLGKLYFIEFSFSGTVTGGSPTQLIFTLPNSATYQNANEVGTCYFNNNGGTEYLAFLTKSATNKVQIRIANTVVIASSFVAAGSFCFEAA